MPEFHEIMVDALHQSYELSGKIVLELGSDPWLKSATALRDRGAARVIASDMTDGWAQNSAENIEIATIDARTASQTLGTSSVDAVFAVNLLEHLEDIPIALESINRILKPGGFVFLHGHPIWTSARGHHAMLGYIGATFSFGAPNDPIPKWSHLYLSRDEMKSALSGHAPEVITAAIDWTFDTKLITRTPRLDILYQFETSPLAKVAIWEDRLEAPSADDIQKIRNGPWWRPNEDYSVRGMTMLMRKA
ncbi:MAG TPA: methyltransferase domain-containing protein [Xanthobacteraceae bacterium]|nr:methyltransferase domain-containing protein [Xanthobacteraceae bacterium]